MMDAHHRGSKKKNCNCASELSTTDCCLSSVRLSRRLRARGRNRQTERLMRRDVLRHPLLAQLHLQEQPRGCGLLQKPQSLSGNASRHSRRRRCHAAWPDILYDDRIGLATALQSSCDQDRGLSHKGEEDI